MVKLELRYNPYRCQSDLVYLDTMNQRLSLGDRVSEYLSGKRIQRYLYPEANTSWTGLFAEIKSLLDEDFYEMDFIGTQDDYDDLMEAYQVYTSVAPGAGRFNLSYRFSKNRSRILEASASYKQLQIDALHKKIKKGGLKNLSTADIEENFNSALNSDFKMLFTAPVSGGKSTLQNSLLGEMILPTDNNAETAVKVETRLTEGHERFTGRAVRADTGKVETLPEPVDQSVMKAYNSALMPEGGEQTAPDDDRQIEDKERPALYDTIYLEAPCKFLKGLPVTPVLVDTPGGNNIMNLRHHDVLMKAITSEDKGIICFVFTAETIDYADTKGALEEVAGAMRRSVDQKIDAERFLFVCNRADGIHDFQQTKQHILNVLANCGITDAAIYFLCARAAELARWGLAVAELPPEQQERSFSGLTQKDQKDYDDYITRYNSSKRKHGTGWNEPVHTYRYSSISKAELEKLDVEEQELQARLRQARAENQDDEANRLELQITEINSGVTALEDAIRTYCEKYALPIKIQQFYDNIKRKAEDQEMLKTALEQVDATEEERVRAHDALRRQKAEYQQAQLLETYLPKVDAVALDGDFIPKQEIDLELKLNKIKPVGTIRLDSRDGEWILTDDFDTYSKGIDSQIAQCLKMAAKSAVDFFNTDAIEKMNGLLEEFRQEIEKLSNQGVFDLNGLNIKRLSPFKAKSPEAIQAATVNNYEKTGFRWVKESGFLAALKRFNPFGSIHSGYQKEDTYDDISYTSVTEYIMNSRAAAKTAFHKALMNCKNETDQHIAALQADVKERMRELDKFIRQQFRLLEQKTADAKAAEAAAKEAKRLADALQEVLEELNRLLDIEEL